LQQQTTPTRKRLHRPAVVAADYTSQKETPPASSSSRLQQPTVVAADHTSEKIFLQLVAAADYNMFKETYLPAVAAADYTN
jgi:hypothetical protein